MFDFSISFIREASHIYFANTIYYHQLLTLYTLYSSIHINFLSSKITADGDCSHETKKMLAPWKKALTNLDSILKSRDIICQQRSI